MTFDEGASAPAAFFEGRSLVFVVEVYYCCFLSATEVSLVGDKVPNFFVTVGVLFIVYNVGVVAVGSVNCFIFGFDDLAVA